MLQRNNNYRPQILGLFIITYLFLLIPFNAEAREAITFKDASNRIMGSYSGSHALLIGVSNYTAGWPSLRNIPSELKPVAGVLKAQGFTVEKVISPDAIQLKESIENFIDRYGFDANNRLLFYFAGHGWTRKHGSKGYLVPSDAPDPHKNEKGFLRKAINMTQILAWSREIEAKHVLFLFDSCFSGTIFKSRALPDIPPQISAMTARPVRQFITAGSAGEQVPAVSVFTPAFVDGIKYGTADLNKDGYISGSELGIYLQTEVPQHAHETPQYGKISDYALSRGDFILLAGSSGEKILPQAEKKRIALRADQLASLEKLAREAISKSRYSRPQGKSGLDYIEKIHDLAPDDFRVTELVGLVISGYLKLVETWMNKNPSKASGYLEQARKASSIYGLEDYNDRFIALAKRLNGIAVITIKGSTTSVGPIAFSPDGSKVLAGRIGKNFKLWDIDGALKETFRGHREDVYIVAFSPDGQQILSSGSGNSVKLWNANNGKFITNIAQISEGVSALAFSPDGSKLIISKANSRSFNFKDKGKGMKVFKELKNNEEWMTYNGTYSIVFSPDGKNILTGIQNKPSLSLKLWDLKGNIIKYFKFKDFSAWEKSACEGIDSDGIIVHSSSFSSDGSKILVTVGYGDGTRCEDPDTHPNVFENNVHLFDVASGKEIRAFKGHVSEVYFASFSPDGSKAISSGFDGTIRLWDVASGNLLHTFRGYDKLVYSVVFSPDGSKFLSGSLDRGVELWDIKRRKVIQVFK